MAKKADKIKNTQTVSILSVFHTEEMRQKSIFTVFLYRFPANTNETDFWEMSAVPERRPSSVETLFLYEALQELGPEFSKFLKKDYCSRYCPPDLFLYKKQVVFAKNLDQFLQSISPDNLTDFSSTESIVLYEALRYMGPDFAKYFNDEYGGVMTLVLIPVWCTCYIFNGVPV